MKMKTNKSQMLVIGMKTEIKFDTYVRNCDEGLKLLIGLVCCGLFLYQTVILLRNFYSNDTFRTIKELDVEGPMPSPLIIICKDPGSLNASEDFARASPYSWSNITMNKIATAFKVGKDFNKIPIKLHQRNCFQGLLQHHRQRHYERN